MPLILRTIKIFKHILHNYVFDITSIVKISILEIRYKIVIKVWEHGQIKYQLYMYNTWVCMDQYSIKLIK